MFERLTDKARMVLVNAQAQAGQLGDSYVSTAHLLLALAVTPDKVAQVALTSYGLTAKFVRERIIEAKGAGGLGSVGQSGFSPKAKKVFEVSLRESVALHHDVITPAHLLLGFAYDPGPVGTRILAQAGVTADQLRARVMQLLASDTAQLEAKPRTGRQVMQSFIRPTQEAELRVKQDAQLQRLLAAAEIVALHEERAEYGLRELIVAALDLPEACQLITSIIGAAGHAGAES